ncbi:serine/arginine repetitive matrix protein 3-like [Hippopotamus amphibius kiboko]|uniref:serine/arginine repetitive matrix protein 3-like n=1 Tax=Hippopotamus amphibius kiboko TaxID=575201 RepID=UPI002598FC5C|nr:serine/arginine repetitive matrix protein 3-like [Hippopotamus amphibius kiboko]
MGQEGSQGVVRVRIREPGGRALQQALRGSELQAGGGTQRGLLSLSFQPFAVPCVGGILAVATERCGRLPFVHPGTRGDRARPLPPPCGRGQRDGPPASRRAARRRTRRGPAAAPPGGGGLWGGAGAGPEAGGCAGDGRTRGRGALGRRRRRQRRRRARTERAAAAAAARESHEPLPRGVRAGMRGCGGAARARPAGDGRGRRRKRQHVEQDSLGARGAAHGGHLTSSCCGLVVCFHESIGHGYLKLMPCCRSPSDAVGPAQTDPQTAAGLPAASARCPGSAPYPALAPPTPPLSRPPPPGSSGAPWVPAAV